MTFEQSEKRKVLRKIAADACAEARTSRNALHTPGHSKERAMVWVGVTSMICLGWLTYTQFLRASDETNEKPQLVDSNNTPRVASGTSTSTPSSAPIVATTANRAVVQEKPDSGPDEDLEKRVAPVEDFARHGDPKAIPAVLDALHDDDWRVRSRAMDAAVNAYVPIPENALIDSAQGDPSPEVRFLALAGVAARIDPAIAQVPAIDRETARSVGRLALNDSSEQVRWQAQQILDALDVDLHAAGSTAPENQTQAETL